jgi:hypothetical protein
MDALAALPPHALRHTWRTVAADCGVDELLAHFMLGHVRRISAKPTSRALCSPPGQPFVKRSARCQSAFCICSALIRRLRQRPLKILKADAMPR